MKRTILALGLSATLLGCTTQINESGFIAQDESTIRYSQVLLSKLSAQTPNHDIKPIELNVEDENVVLHGLHLDNKNTNNTILYIPGNGMSVADSAEGPLINLAKYEFDIVIFDRRGLGATKGPATIANLIKDANLSYHFTKDKLSADTLIVHGFSLGSFVAAQVAKKQPIDGLVMEGSATNVDEWVDEAMPWYAKVLFDVQIDKAFYSVDNKQVLRDAYRGPLLVIGGGQDKQTPISLTHKLFSASQSTNKQLIIADEAGHNDMFNNKEVRAAYQTFLSHF
ncbi:hypothetical protein A7985_06905 [Pseudoalteromonas luteoviolacea]|uniref:AB hydrolase-1 domain-containing protein n=1 Tax=Pseudoalteromonas luteoviolacea TaxID=43657 RepID=A0A1C0TWF9_9GAMM|nr:alpha/beta hydrolase [Pseudoalteromonas luteoviolacea]OCQ23665.1 hypothetical protein A7985_06905 [Pseudoalteromonas luteoviolacea]